MSRLGLALVPLAFLVLALIIFWRIESETKAAAAWAQHSADVLEQADALKDGVNDAEDAVRRYSLTGSASSRAAIARAAARLPLAAARLTELVADNPAQRGAAETIFALAAAEVRDPNGSTENGLRAALAAFDRTENALEANRRIAATHLWNELTSAMYAILLGGTVVAIVTLLVMAQRKSMLERYRLLAEHSRDAILFIRRRDARIVQANRAAAELYGYDLSELLRMTGYDLRAASTVASADEQIPKVGVFTKVVETEHRRKDGTTFPVEASMQSAYLDREHMVLNIVRDITQRHAAEEEMQKALRAATEASRLKSEFVATMSHEIRTPLNGVIGMAELLLDSNLDPEQREFATTARDSGHSLLGVINNILDFSKIEAGKVEVEITEFDLIRKIESIATMLGAQAHKKGISIMTYVDPSIPPMLLGDALRLRQVLVNLAGNAVKFTNEGGVAVIVDPVHLGAESVQLRFAVRDTGIGIAPSALPKLFEAFTQANGSMSRRFGGTGLGLTISHRLVEIMGGTLEAESEPGHGSTFRFSLTLRVAAEQGQLRRELRHLRAIVVDDDVMARDILSRYAASWGLQTSVAETAEEALAMINDAHERGMPFSVAIVDQRLPAGCGVEMGRAIKADPRLAETRLLLVTAFDAPGQGEEAIRAGFDAYLTKPVRQSQLYDAILDALLGRPNHDVGTQSRSEAATAHAGAILLVEDNGINRQVFMRQLQRLGYHAQWAGDGSEALERIAKERFDIVFMDCQMPVMDGFEATRAIRKIESRTGTHLPIVAMTANALAGDRADCIAAGMDDYVAKPVSLGEVARILAQWLPQTNGEVPALDLNRIREIFGDDPVALHEFFSTAIPSIRNRCQRLLHTSDRGELRDLAHELRGAAANIGALELAAAAERLETSLKGSAEGPMPAATEILQACSRLETVAP